MVDPNQHFSSWDPTESNQRSQQTMQSGFPPARRSTSVDDAFSSFQFSSSGGSRSDSMAGGFVESAGTSSSSSLSNAMSIAHAFANRSPAQSSTSSPASEVSNHSHEFHMSWLPGAGAHGAHPQSLTLPTTHTNMGQLSFSDMGISGHNLSSPHLDTSSIPDPPQTPSLAPLPPPYSSPASRFMDLGQRQIVRRSSSASQGNATRMMHHTHHPNSSSSRVTLQSGVIHDEAESLRAKLREIEQENVHLRRQIVHFQNELQTTRNGIHGGGYMGQSGQAGPLLPTVPGIPSASPAAISTEMEHSWRKRTDARVRRFCAPNRAGNALCAWHDTRRERRQHPPRMAPAGTLNCGCSYEEALFEESLARHGVGSYHPGDCVRMDPSLRNPLLKLLQERYGYRDGDFERDPHTGVWVEGEGHEVWEAELLKSGSNPRSRR